MVRHHFRVTVDEVGGGFGELEDSGEEFVEVVVAEAVGGTGGFPWIWLLEDGLEQ
jgi:hypothetical protein